MTIHPLPTTIMNKILVPTDFSDCAGYAADVAIKLAPKMSAEVHLYTRVAVDPKWSDYDAEIQQKYPESATRIEEAKANLKALKEAYTEDWPSIVTTYSHGDIVEVISTYIDKENIDFIVMGSSGADGIKEAIFGSNAQKIVRHAHCPVMVIKHPVADKNLNFKNIVFASDFRPEAKAAFHKLINFAQHFGSHIHLVSIASYPAIGVDDKVKFRMEEFQQMGHETVKVSLHEFVDFNVELGITHFANEINADLIALANYGKDPIKRIFTGSISETLVNHLEIPILALNTKDLKIWRVEDKVHESKIS